MVIARSVEMVKGSNVGISGVEEMSGVRNVKHEFTESKIMTAHFHLPDIHFAGPIFCTMPISGHFRSEFSRDDSAVESTLGIEYCVGTFNGLLHAG